MKFCSQCGATVTVRTPVHDHLPRHVCDRCETIHYQNPKIVAGCIAEWHDEVLLCRRAIEPRVGLWTLPAGFMENRETTLEAAARETWEEAMARVTELSLFGLFNLPHIDQVYVIFRGHLENGSAAAGPESSEVQLYREATIPWDSIAFPVVKLALELYFSDRKRGTYGTHVADVIRHADRRLEIRHHE